MKARSFIALDGEGYTNADGNHLYNLLADSTGFYIHDDNGLSSRACFEYLLALRQRTPGSIYVSFYFSYDVNKILTSLSKTAIKRLGQEGYIRIKDHREEGMYYRLEYQPRKWFSISRQMENEGVIETVPRSTIKIYDVWGFFQGSFLGAIKLFNVATPGELKFIEDMKFGRADFKTSHLETIIKYNKLECDLLVKLMETVDEKFQFLGLILSQWHGAGAVAGQLLNKMGIKEHIYSPQLESHKEAVMRAYFGGRVQCFKIGMFEDVHGYDIVSAYPSAMAELNSLQGCEETYSDTFIDDYPYAVYDISWEIPLHHKLTPFPFRNPKGTIEYPYSGRGCYWYYEVKAAMDLYGVDCITINNGYIFDCVDTATKPFSFIQELFEFRKVLKAQGNMAQQCIKLALNSLYGKTAQAIGHKGKPPVMQCYIYAGMITSKTRANLMYATFDKQESLISFATDGIIVEKPLDVTVSESLGDWEYKPYSSAFVIKPGFYVLQTKEGPIIRVRGFPKTAISQLRSFEGKVLTKEELDSQVATQTPFDAQGFDVLASVWKYDGLSGMVPVPITQFIGMKSSSAKRPMGQWIVTSRTIKYRPSRGEPSMIGTTKKGSSYLITQAYVKEDMSHVYYKGIHEQYNDTIPESEYFPDFVD